MGIDAQKSDNLVLLLDGLSLLDQQDQDRVFGMVNTLDCADKNVKDSMFPDTPFLSSEILSANAGDKI